MILPIPKPVRERRPRKRLQNRTPIRRRTPLRPYHPVRRARLYQRNYGPHADFLRTRPCVVAAYVRPEVRTPCSGPLQVAHRECRQRGGCGADWRRTFCACEFHHRQQEGRTAAFEKRYQVDLRQVVEFEILADPGLSQAELDAAQDRLERLRREVAP